MQNVSDEIEKYLIVCKNLKGLSPLSIKAYTIDLKQFNAFIKDRDCFTKECLIDYIERI